MNMFKGLLFLQGHLTRRESLEGAPRAAYGARTAAAEFGARLGNHAASGALFGRDIGRPLSVVVAPAPRDIQSTRTVQTRSPRKQQTGLLDHLLLLGGRPMHAGNNLDIEEPFEPFAREGLVAQQERRRGERRITAGVVQTQMQTCNG